MSSSNQRCSLYLAFLWLSTLVVSLAYHQPGRDALTIVCDCAESGNGRLGHTLINCDALRCILLQDNFITDLNRLLPQLAKAINSSRPQPRRHRASFKVR